jgi:Putative peptidoglycan binding domain
MVCPRPHEALTNSEGSVHAELGRIALMPSDTRRTSNDGRDDWLGSSELDWGESPTGTRPPVGRRPAAGEPLWDDMAPAGHPDADIIRRRRLIALVGGLVALGVVIVIALVAFGGNGGDNTAAQTTTSVAEQTPTTPTTTPQTNTTPNNTPTTPENTTPSTPTITLAAGESLKEGSTGQEVKDVQQALTTLGYDPGAVDGNFGAKTKFAVGEFQRAHNLTDDGVVGASTAKAINDAIAAESTGTTPTSDATSGV